MKVKVKKYTGVYGGYKLKNAEYEEPNFYNTLENPNSFKIFEQKLYFLVFKADTPREKVNGT